MGQGELASVTLEPNWPLLLQSQSRSSVPRLRSPFYAVGYPAGGAVGRATRRQRRPFGGAAARGLRAARDKRTAVTQRLHVRRCALDLCQASAARFLYRWN